jgi:hypothetical protein
MEEGLSSRNNCSSVQQTMVCIVNAAECYYCNHKSPQLVLTLSQINPIHAISVNITYTLILFPTKAYGFQLVSFTQISHQYPVSASSLQHTCHMHCPPHASLYHQDKLTIFC